MTYARVRSKQTLVIRAAIRKLSSERTGALHQHTKTHIHVGDLQSGPTADIRLSAPAERQLPQCSRSSTAQHLGTQGDNAKEVEEDSVPVLRSYTDTAEHWTESSFMLRPRMETKLTRTLDVRRHSIRSKPSQELTEQGRMLAAKSAESLSHVDQVLVSELGRGANTAIAMGYKVSRSIPGLGDIDGALIEQISWPSPLSYIAEACRENEQCRAFAEAQRMHWQHGIERLPEATNTLLISHGGIMELGLIGCVPDEDFEAIGDVFAYCEGFRLSFCNEVWSLEHTYRVDHDLRIVNTD